METFLPYFTGKFSLRWQDLLDIVLLSLGFYRILILIKGTRTIPMLIGFVALLGLYLVSLMMNLEATQLLLDNLGQSLVLVLVVLFQADIRNALAQIGVFTLSGKVCTKKGMWWTAYSRLVWLCLRKALVL